MSDRSRYDGWNLAAVDRPPLRLRTVVLQVAYAAMVASAAIVEDFAGVTLARRGKKLGVARASRVPT